jgi:imidazolonepropionase-like amidohydrolase
MLSCTSTDARPQDHAGNCLCHRPEIQALNRRLGAGLSRRSFVGALAAVTLSSPGLARAQDAARPVLFKNVRMFDGQSSTLRAGQNVLVEGTRIKAIDGGNQPAPDNARVIDGGGRVLMPGLIDAHVHTLLAGLPLPVLLTAEVPFIHLAAAAEAQRTLLRGFTTVRDLGGPAFALKKAIDDGMTAGPRIYPCGAMITASGGHGDLRPLSDIPSDGKPTVTEQTGASIIADGPDAIRKRVREQLLQGASQVKLVASGGVSTPRSPLDTASLTEAELRAGVEAARDWSTYVAVHAFTPLTIRRAIDAGAACIEHGHLMDDATAALLGDKGIWLSIQPFVTEEDNGPLPPEAAAKARQVRAATDTAYRLIQKHRIKMAFGTDLLFSPTLAKRQGLMLGNLRRWYTPAEILRIATSGNAELLGLSGPRNPYAGKLGVVEPDALADLLLVDGNPLDDIALLGDPEKNLLVVMKDGKVHKDSLKS